MKAAEEEYIDKFANPFPAAIRGEYHIYIWKYLPYWVLYTAPSFYHILYLEVEVEKGISLVMSWRNRLSCAGKLQQCYLYMIAELVAVVQ